MMKPVALIAQLSLSNSYSHEWGKVISLDGEWEIAEGGKQQVPTQFLSKIPVPGLVTSAKPGFKAVGEESKLREAYWYRKKFKVQGSLPALTRLKIFKSMFGTKVFLNGAEVGESELCFTSLYFNLTLFLKGNNQENELIVRVGAHISALSDSVVTGGDPERHLYPPGLYDHVQLLLSDDAYILRTQIAPHINSKSIKVEVDFAAEKFSGNIINLKAVVYDYKTGKQVANTFIESGPISRGEEKKVTLTIPLKECKLWSPDSPNLYVLQLSDKNYSYKTRFGMRGFTLDRRYTNKALLNNKRCFIRGTNFAIHRFFEDSLSKQHSWDREWVRKLFRRFTNMGMNGVRFVFSPAPEMWYEIADEEGMMVFDEYAIWYAYQPLVGSVAMQAADPYKKWSIWPKNLTTKQLVKEYTAWMQDRWNHASVIVWDAQNETWATQTGEAIKQVRKLDLSNRVWDNGWSAPVDPGDLREAHPYFEGWVAGTEMTTVKEKGRKPFSLADLADAELIPATLYAPFQSALKIKIDWYWKQPVVINEYSYLWLNRDGTPTILTKAYYDAVLGVDATADQRRELYARYLAAVTEYWRAKRSCLGILYPFGLAASIPGGATSDNLIDINKIEFDEHFKKFVPDAFAALGVCAELWKTEFKIKSWGGTQAAFNVAIINDLDSAFSDYFIVKVMKGNSVVSTNKYKYEVRPFELNRTPVRIELPEEPGTYEIVTELYGRKDKMVSSYRQIKML
ncbi:MAG: glycoside hydrolase family 2 TIM barrel-domain containing protein [Bacteroidota bacterium]